MRLPNRSSILSPAALLAGVLVVTGCGTSEEDARQELADLNIKYTEKSFAEHAGRAPPSPS